MQHVQMLIQIRFLFAAQLNVKYATSAFRVKSGSNAWLTHWIPMRHLVFGVDSLNANAVRFSECSLMKKIGLTG